MMLAGSGLFIIDQILPSLTGSKNKMLGIARMAMNWQVDQIINCLRERGLSFNQEMAEYIRQHNNSYSSREFFKLCGFEHYDDLDFDASEGCNIIHNLNELLPEQYHQQYDFVCENGTIEHIFDIKNAVGSIALAVKPNGYVLHISPLDAFNHGFYNLSINFFADFYRANGFDNMQFYLTRSSGEWFKGKQDVHIEKFAYTHEEFYIKPDIYTSDFNKLGIAFFARKTKHFPTIQIPTQAAYDRSLQLSSRLNSW